MRVAVYPLFLLLPMVMSGCAGTIPISNEDTMYKTYRVQKVNEPLEINADWDKPVWQGVKPITPQLYMGENPEHNPKTQAKVVWDDEHIYVIFRVEDRYVRAVAKEYFELVCRDSCVEFFLTPQEDSAKGYFNLETNCIGTILMYHQLSRGVNNRPLDVKDLNTIRMATSFPKGKPIDPEIAEPVVWTLEYALPWKMLRNYAEVAAPAPGVKWRANFYKCGDNTSHPHWLTWSKIPLEKPDFHQPKYFGTLELVK